MGYIDTTKEYILCAAIKRKVPRDIAPYFDNDICNIEIGYRHHDILQRFSGEVSKLQFEQGFYTSKGRFVDRNEAMMLAFFAGQVDKERAVLTKYRENPNESYIQLYDEYKDFVKVRTMMFYNLFSEDLY